MNNRELLKELDEVRRINGIVIRAIINVVKLYWFTFRNLQSALSSHGLKDGEIIDALDYLESAGYIEARMNKNNGLNVNAPVRIVDFISEIELIEIKLTHKGKLAALGAIRDDGIEI